MSVAGEGFAAERPARISIAASAWKFWAFIQVVATLDHGDTIAGRKLTRGPFPVV
jgi:hypothetical protein